MARAEARAEAERTRRRRRHRRNARVGGGVGVERDDESARAWKTSARADAGDASNGAANPSTPREEGPVPFVLGRGRPGFHPFFRSTAFDARSTRSTGPGSIGRLRSVTTNRPVDGPVQLAAAPRGPRSSAPDRSSFPSSRRTPPRARGPALSAARPLDARGRRRDGSRARRPSPPRAPRLARGDAPSRRPRPSPPSPRPSHPDTAVRAPRRVDDREREDAEDARRLPRGGGGRTRTRYTR